MAVLLTKNKSDFNELKTTLEVTDGNLASHLKALEKEQYIEVVKRFVGRKPNTQYLVTKLGKTEFQKHLNALETLISSNNK